MPDQEQNYPDIIHLSEATHTWGCHYTIPGNDKIHYGLCPVQLTNKKGPVD